jgi:excisionase family DNA binding protein
MDITLQTKDLLSVAQAAQEIGCARLTIYRWVAASKVISVRFGGLIYIPLSEVERLKK